MTHQRSNLAPIVLLLAAIVVTASATAGVHSATEPYSIARKLVINAVPRGGENKALANNMFGGSDGEGGVDQVLQSLAAAIIGASAATGIHSANVPYSNARNLAIRAVRRGGDNKAPINNMRGGSDGDGGVDQVLQCLNNKLSCAAKQIKIWLDQPVEEEEPVKTPTVQSNIATVLSFSGVTLVTTAMFLFVAGKEEQFATMNVLALVAILAGMATSTEDDEWKNFSGDGIVILASIVAVALEKEKICTDMILPVKDCIMAFVGAAKKKVLKQS